MRNLGRGRKELAQNVVGSEVPACTVLRSRSPGPKAMWLCCDPAPLVVSDGAKAGHLT